jgi:ubiquinone/menaquinone biosynthesis C-methylase UbiE
MKEAQYKKYSGIVPMLERAGVDFKGKILDVGMGTGLFEDYLRGQGRQVDVNGIEIDARMMAEAKKKGYNVSAGTAEELPFKDSSFDFVVCLDTIHLVRDKEKAVAEMLRVLKPDKHLLVSHFCNAFTKNDVIKAMESLANNLNVIDKKLVGHSDSELAVAFLIKK